MSPATLLDQLAGLDPQERREVATIVRGLSETFAEVSDGKTTSHVLGVLAQPARPVLSSAQVVPKTYRYLADEAA